jgi:hypothetical protein
MNRPLKRKLENAVLAFLDAHKDGTPFEELTIVSGHGTSLANEIALDADSDAEIKVQEPEMPYLAVFAQTRADRDLPNCYAFEIVCHYKHDATDSKQRRYDADQILRAIADTLTSPPDEDELTEQSNAECGALLAFANIDPNPEAADDRPAFRRPLHIYGMWPTAENTLFDDTAWHDQISFAGDAQDIDARDLAA